MQQQKQPRTLPAWLQEAMEGDVTDDVLNKRSEPRHIFASPASLQPVDGAAACAPTRVRIFNASESGVAFICRDELQQGDVLSLHPRHEDASDIDAAITVCVVHCTQTVQGYKIGCVFE